MKANLIKDEQDLDNLHPKKTVLNVKSKNFKTKDGKKNRNIRQKSLNKLTSKTPPEEDLDTESSDDHNELGYYSDPERLPESDSEELDKEEEEEEMLKEEELSDEDRIRSVLEKEEARSKNRVQYLFDLIEGYSVDGEMVSDDEIDPK